MLLEKVCDSRLVELAIVLTYACHSHAVHVWLLSKTPPGSIALRYEALLNHFRFSSLQRSQDDLTLPKVIDLVTKVFQRSEPVSQKGLALLQPKSRFNAEEVSEYFICCRHSAHLLLD